MMALGFFAWVPPGLRARYRNDVAQALADVPVPPPVTEADLVPLPPPVQRYLRIAGVVGQPVDGRPGGRAHSCRAERRRRDVSERNGHSAE